MIEYVARNGAPEAMNCPAFVCDACRKQVVGEGNVFWAIRYTATGRRESSPLFVSHKDRCSLAVERLVESVYPDSDGWSGALDEEIAVFLGHLTDNLTRAFADDPEGAYLNHTLVQPTPR